MSERAHELLQRLIARVDHLLLHATSPLQTVVALQQSAVLGQQSMEETVAGMQSRRGRSGGRRIGSRGARDGGGGWRLRLLLNVGLQ